MTEARALAATERCRELVANPRQWGLEPRPGLEPLDVVVKLNNEHRRSTAKYQVIARMKLSLDGSGVPPFTEAAALVAQGHTEAEALEMFYNWLADDKAVSVFVESVKAHQLDALAKEALADKAKAEAAQTAKAKDFQQTWVERTTDKLGRKFGFIKPRIQR